jgi:hypothetical protein
VTLIIYFVIGRLLIWFLQTAGPIKYLYKRSNFLIELFECDFCLGCWVFLGLGLAFKVALLDILPYILDVTITAIVASFVLHIFIIGWRTQYGTTYVE